MGRVISINGSNPNENNRSSRCAVTHPVLAQYVWSVLRRGYPSSGLWDIHGLTTLRFPEFRRVSVRVESEGVKGKETSIDEVCAGIDADTYSGWNRFKSLGLFKTQNQL